MDLGKMRKSASEYACKVILPMKKDGRQRFCGNYRPLNHQTRQDQSTSKMNGLWKSGLTKGC